MYGISVMSKYSKVEGHVDLVRDETSSAIINTNVEQYRLVMKRREVMKEAQRSEINTLKQEVTEIKGLLKDIIEKLHA